MYRQYENPYALEQKLTELKNKLDEAYALGTDFDELQDLELEIAELKDRVNFAWQDDEYDHEGGN